MRTTQLILAALLLTWALAACDRLEVPVVDPIRDEAALQDGAGRTADFERAFAAAARVQH